MVCAAFSPLTADVILVRSTEYYTRLVHVLYGILKLSFYLYFYSRPSPRMVFVSIWMSDALSPLSHLLWSAWRTCLKVSCSHALRWGHTYSNWQSSCMSVPVIIFPFTLSLRAHQLVSLTRLFALPDTKYSLNNSKRRRIPSNSMQRAKTYSEWMLRFYGDIALYKVYIGVSYYDVVMFTSGRERGPGGYQV